MRVFDWYQNQRPDLERRIQGLSEVLKYPLLSQEWVKLCGLQIWPLHSQGPSEQKVVKNLGEKGAWTYPGAAQSF